MADTGKEERPKEPFKVYKLEPRREADAKDTQLFKPLPNILEDLSKARQTLEEAAPVIRAHELTSPEEVADFLLHLEENTDELVEQEQLVETFKIMDLKLLDLLIAGLTRKQSEEAFARKWNMQIHGKLLVEAQRCREARTLSEGFLLEVNKADVTELNRMLGVLGAELRDTMGQSGSPWKIQEIQSKMMAIQTALGRKL